MTREYAYGTQLESSLKPGAPFVDMGNGAFEAVS